MRRQYTTVISSVIAQHAKYRSATAVDRDIFNIIGIGLYRRIDIGAARNRCNITVPVRFVSIRSIHAKNRIMARTVADHFVRCEVVDHISAKSRNTANVYSSQNINIIICRQKMVCTGRIIDDVIDVLERIRLAIASADDAAI